MWRIIFLFIGELQFLSYYIVWIIMFLRFSEGECNWKLYSWGYGCRWTSLDNCFAVPYFCLFWTKLIQNWLYRWKNRISLKWFRQRIFFCWSKAFLYRKSYTIKLSKQLEGIFKKAYVWWRYQLCLFKGRVESQSKTVKTIFNEWGILIIYP